jgi:hypothetical protein
MLTACVVSLQHVPALHACRGAKGTSLPRRALG